MEEYLFIDSGLNTQTFERFKKFKLSEHPEIIEELEILPGGDIIGVKFEAVKNALEDYEVEMIRNERKKIPLSFELETAEDFWKIVAIYIPLEESLR